jgi:hypothetical protein
MVPRSLLRAARTRARGDEGAAREAAAGAARREAERMTARAVARAAEKAAAARRLDPSP